MPPESPSCIIGLDEPLPLIPFIITVIRFAQDGMPVKSMLVPLVVATAVESVSGCESFAGVTAALANCVVPIAPAARAEVVCVVASSNVMPEDVMEVGMVKT
jgi:hypothetical protein